MFGHSEIGVYAFGEFPPFRTAWALVGRLAVLPAYFGRTRAAPRQEAFVSLQPR